METLLLDLGWLMLITCLGVGLCLSAKLVIWTFTKEELTKE